MKQPTNSLPLLEVNNFNEVTQWLPFDINNAPEPIKGRGLLVQKYEIDYVEDVVLFTVIGNQWIDTNGNEISRYSFDYTTTYRLINL